MTLKEKCVLPVVISDITKEDISKEVKFIKVAFSDINKPMIQDCIFLMYEYDFTAAFTKLTKKFEKEPSYYSSYPYLKNGIRYIIFAFKIIDKHNVNYIKDSLFEFISILDKFKIINLFPNDLHLFTILFSGTNDKEPLSKIEEEDFTMSYDDIIIKKHIESLIKQEEDLTKNS